MVFNRFAVYLVAMAAVLLSTALPGLTSATRAYGAQSVPGASFYSVSRIADGIELTLQFGRPDYPRHALIAATATLRNLSHPNLAVERSRRPFGLCSWPAVSFVSANAAVQNVEPAQPIPVPVPPCPFPGVVDLPIGQTFVEHQIVVLWSSRLMATAQVFNHVDNGYDGFSFQGPTARFRLHSAPAPTVTIQQAGAYSAALVSLPPGAQGRLYYRSWDTCGAVLRPAVAYYWTQLYTHRLVSSCDKWHLDVAALNMPVATLNLGVSSNRLSEVAQRPLSLSRPHSEHNHLHPAHPSPAGQ